jgi:hypothetical protein
VDRDFPDAVPAPRRAELMERLLAELDGRLPWLAEHGLRRTSAAWPYAHYESGGVLLDLGYGIVHGPQLSLGATLQQRGDAEAHSLGSAQRLCGLPEHPSRDTVIDNEEDLGPAVERLGTALRTIEPLLAGQEAAWAGLRRRGSEALAGNALESALRHTRPEARDAFKTGDYERVVALLDPLESHLERHEQGWLDYARRKLAERP